VHLHPLTSTWLRHCVRWLPGRGLVEGWFYIFTKSRKSGPQLGGEEQLRLSSPPGGGRGRCSAYWAREQGRAAGMARARRTPRGRHYWRPIWSSAVGCQPTASKPLRCLSRKMTYGKGYESPDSDRVRRMEAVAREEKS
jgi:hypothetical protein